MKIRHTVENEITWEQLKAAVVAGTVTAQTQPFSEIDITLEDGEVITAVVAAWLPAVADKPAGIRFIFRDCLDAPHQMNDSRTNKGGYKASEGRRYILEEVYPCLPTDLRAVIRPRKIAETTREGTLEYEDSLWLPSETDLFGRGVESRQNGDADGSEDFQLPIFMTERDRVKQRRRYGTTPYWCRSVFFGNGNGFCGVSTYGGISYSSAHNSWGVAPGFDI